MSADKSMAEAMMAEAYRVKTQVDAAEASKALENSGLRVTKAKERLEEARLFAAQQETEASKQAQRAQVAFHEVRSHEERSVQLNEAASKAAAEAVRARAALEPHKVLLDAARVAADDVVAKADAARTNARNLEQAVVEKGRLAQLDVAASSATAELEQREAEEAGLQQKVRALELEEQKQLNLAKKPKQRLRKVKKDLELERKEWANASAALKSEVAQLRNETKSLKHLATATEMTPDEQIAVARVSEQAAGDKLSVVAPPKVSARTLEKLASVAAAAAAEKAAVAASNYARIMGASQQASQQGHSSQQALAANAAGMAAEAATVAAGAAKTALKSGAPPKAKAKAAKRAVALHQSAAHRKEAGLDHEAVSKEAIGAAASVLSASKSRADSSAAAAAAQLAAAASKLEEAQMAQAAMRNKAVAAEAKKVEQAVMAEALASSEEKAARHKETETEVGKLKMITRKLLKERADAEGKLRAAEVSLRQTDKYAKELASARKAEMASALVQKEQRQRKPQQPPPQQSQPPPANRAGSTSTPTQAEPTQAEPTQAERRKQRRQQKKVHEQVAKFADMSSGIWTDPDGAAVGGATVELLPTAPLVRQVVQQLDPKHAGLNRPQQKPATRADSRAAAAAAAAERPPSLQQEQEKEMLQRVVDGLTRIGCTNATDDYIVARDEEEASAKLANARDRVLFAAKQMREADLKVSMVDSLDVGRPQGVVGADGGDGADGGSAAHRAPMAEARALRILAQRDYDAAVADEQRAEVS